MKSDNIQLLFATAIKTYVPVEGQSSDPDLSTLQETLTALLLPITYDGEKGIHKLVGLIMDEDAYKTRYGANFPTPSRPEIYDIKITFDETQCREGPSRGIPHSQEGEIQAIRCRQARVQEVYPRCRRRYVGT